MLYLLGGISKANELNINVITIVSTSFENMNDMQIASYLKSQNITGIIFYGLSKEDIEIHKLIERELFDVVVVDADAGYMARRSLYAIMNGSNLDWKFDVASYAGGDQDIEMGGVWGQPTKSSPKH